VFFVTAKNVLPQHEKLEAVNHYREPGGKASIDNLERPIGGAKAV
jgi:hypothetical protein